MPRISTFVVSSEDVQGAGSAVTLRYPRFEDISDYRTSAELGRLTLVQEDEFTRHMLRENVVALEGWSDEQGDPLPIPADIPEDEPWPYTQAEVGFLMDCLLRRRLKN